MFMRHSNFLAPRTGLRRVVALALVAAVVAMRVYAMPAAADINATVTSDNAYSFGWGDADGIGGPSGHYEGPSITYENKNTWFTRCPAGPGPDFHGVEQYSIPAGHVLPGHYLYVAAYSDDYQYQGLLGTFIDDLSGFQIHTGDDRWQVCATGENFDGEKLDEDDPLGVPSLATINSHIGQCNAWTTAGGSGPATTSAGWVDAFNDFGKGEIYFGGFNDSSATPTGPWGPITCISPAARWMWFNSDPDTIADPTAGGGDHKEYLIFRLPLDFEPPCPTVSEPIVECVPGALGSSGCYKVTVSVQNISTAPIDSVLIQGHGATPSVVTINPPLDPGDGRSITVTICPDPSVIAGGVASLTYIFPGTHECCRQEIRFELPACGTDYCFGIPRVWAECVPGDANAIDLKFEFDPPPGGGGTLHIGGGLIMPDMIPIPLGNTNLVIGPLHIADAPGPLLNSSTGVVTRRYCTTLYLTPDGETGTCCQERVCFDLPTCGLPATPFIPPTDPTDLTDEDAPADGSSR